MNKPKAKDSTRTKAISRIGMAVTFSRKLDLKISLNVKGMVNLLTSVISATNSIF